MIGIQPSQRLAGQVAVVTGGAKGLGLAATRRLMSDGAHVVFADIDEEALTEVGEFDDRAMAAVCDVADSAAVDRLVGDVLRRYGRLDIMVANAGIGGGAPVVDMTDEAFRRVLATNLEGAFYCCRAAAGAMVPARSGVIITVGSIFGRDTPAGAAAYGASKAGVVALTQALARELGPSGIRVNCISPGNMDTEMHWTALRRRAEHDGLSQQTVVDRVRAAVPLGRHGEPEEFAALVAFLASSDASYITGQTINVDGGYQPR